MELSDLDLYHTEHCALVQNKQLGTLKGMVHITYLWVSCWRYFFFYIGNSFICKTSPTSNDSDLIQQPQWESCLVNDDLPETYLFKAVWIHLMWLMISFTISLLSLACVQYKNVILQSLYIYISERYIKHLQAYMPPTSQDRSVDMKQKWLIDPLDGMVKGLEFKWWLNKETNKNKLSFLCPGTERLWRIIWEKEGKELQEQTWFEIPLRNIKSRDNQAHITDLEHIYQFQKLVCIFRDKGF